MLFRKWAWIDSLFLLVRKFLISILLICLFKNSKQLYDENTMGLEKLEEEISSNILKLNIKQSEEDVILPLWMLYMHIFSKLEYTQKHEVRIL